MAVSLDLVTVVEPDAFLMASDVTTSGLRPELEPELELPSTASLDEAERDDDSREEASRVDGSREEGSFEEGSRDEDSRDEDSRGFASSDGRGREASFELLDTRGSDRSRGSVSGLSRGSFGSERASLVSERELASRGSLGLASFASLEVELGLASLPSLLDLESDDLASEDRSLSTLASIFGGSGGGTVGFIQPEMMFIANASNMKNAEGLCTAVSQSIPRALT